MEFAIDSHPRAHSVNDAVFLSLQTDILNVLHPYEYDSTNLPFDHGELIVMATFCLGGGKLLRCDVNQWVINTSIYYKVKDTSAPLLQDPNVKDDYGLFDVINDVFNNYHLPLTPVGHPDSDTHDLRALSVS